MTPPVRLAGLDRPLVALTIDSVGCPYEVRLNDVPILRARAGYPMALQRAPVNHHLWGGLNTVECRIGDPDSAPVPTQAECQITLEVRSRGTPGAGWVEILSLTARGSEAATRGANLQTPGGTAETDAIVGDLVVVPGPNGRQLTAARTIELRLPWGPWSWVDGRRFEGVDQADRELREAVSGLWATLSGKDSMGVRRAWVAKTAELRLAYGLSNEQAEREVGVLPLVDRGDVELAPLDLTGFRTEIFGGGRLAQMIDEDGDGPLYFREPATGLAYYLGAIFSRAADGLVLIR